MKDPIDFLNDGKIREMTLEDGTKIYIYGVGVLSVLIGEDRKTAKWHIVNTNELSWFRPYIKWKDKKTYIEKELFLDEFKISKERKK